MVEGAEVGEQAVHSRIEVKGVLRDTVAELGAGRPSRAPGRALRAATHGRHAAACTTATSIATRIDAVGIARADSPPLATSSIAYR